MKEVNRGDQTEIWSSYIDLTITNQEQEESIRWWSLVDYVDTEVTFQLETAAEELIGAIQKALKKSTQIIKRKDGESPSAIYRGTTKY